MCRTAVHRVIDNKLVLIERGGEKGVHAIVSREEAVRGTYSTEEDRTGPSCPGGSARPDPMADEVFPWN